MVKLIQIKKGSWSKYKETIKHIEHICFMQGDRTDLSWYKEIINKKDDTIAILIKDKQEPIGFLICNPIEDCGSSLKKWDKNYNKYNTLYLVNISVMPKYRSQGWGSILIRIMIKEAKRNGYARITMHTNNKRFMNSCIRNYGFKKLFTDKMEGNIMTYLEKRLEWYDD